MIQTIVIVEHDGMEQRCLSMSFEVPNEEFDLLSAVKAASTDYCMTKEGRKTYEYNCSCFNWADFDESVPNEFCERYGFTKVSSSFCDTVLDWDEHLVDDDILAENTEESV